MNATAVAVKQDDTLSSKDVWANDCLQVAPELSVVPEPEPVRLLPSRVPQWLPKMVEKINSLLALPENWDSYGAKRINSEVAINAIKLLCSVMKEDTPFPSIVPVSSGDLQVEWHVFDIDLEIVVYFDGYRIAHEEVPTGNQIMYLTRDRTEHPIDDIGACLQPVAELTARAIDER